MHSLLKMALLTPFVVGCASTTVERVGEVSKYKTGSCDVEVYRTKSDAQDKGKIKELCVITGSSAFSFDHSIKGAIKKNVGEVCGCGASNAYVRSSHRDISMGINGPSHVTLVAFRFIKPD